MNTVLPMNNKEGLRDGTGEVAFSVLINCYATCLLNCVLNFKTSKSADRQCKVCRIWLWLGKKSGNEKAPTELGYWVILLTCTFIWTLTVRQWLLFS